MAVLKRITAQAGESQNHAGSPRRVAGGGGWVCTECHRQSQLVPMDGAMVCALCGESPKP